MAHECKALRLDMDAGTFRFVVHGAVLWDADSQEAVLIDTGIPRHAELIREAFEREGIPFERLTKILITHQDMDHIGSLPELKALLGDQLQVWAHPVGVPYIQGEVPLIKSRKMAPPVQVDRTLLDGEVLPLAGGLQVIHTPGHTPDHLSLFHLPSGTLITGDALTSQDGVLMPFDPQYTMDHELAMQSIAKLQALPVRAAIAYHNGVCEEGVQERLKEIVAAGLAGMKLE